MRIAIGPSSRPHLLAVTVNDQEPQVIGRDGLHSFMRRLSDCFPRGQRPVIELVVAVDGIDGRAALDAFNDQAADAAQNGD